MIIDEIRKYVATRQYGKAYLTDDIIQSQDFERWLTKITEEARIRNEVIREDDINELKKIWNDNIITWLDLATKRKNTNTREQKKDESPLANAISATVTGKILKEDMKTQTEMALKMWAKSLEISGEFAELYEKYMNRIIIKNHIDTANQEEATNKILSYIDTYILAGLEGKDTLVHSLSEELGRVKLQNSLLIKRYKEVRNKASELAGVLYTLVSRESGVSSILPDINREMLSLDTMISDMDRLIDQMQEAGQ